MYVVSIHNRARLTLFGQQLQEPVNDRQNQMNFLIDASRWSQTVRSICRSFRQLVWLFSPFDKSEEWLYRKGQCSGVTIGRARRAVHAGPALWGAQNLPNAVFKSYVGSLYNYKFGNSFIGLWNRNCSASNEQFQSAHSGLLLTENVPTCWINDFVGVP